MSRAAFFRKSKVRPEDNPPVFFVVTFFSPFPFAGFSRAFFLLVFSFSFCGVF